MGRTRATFLSLVNRLGQAVPKRLQRLVADFPGALKLFERLSRDAYTDIPTPEGQRLVLNPLFHSHLVTAGDVGNYEPDIRQSILRLATPGMAAYDIGANVGVFTFLLASIVGDEGIVYAFEPEQNNCVCFERSLELNRIRNVILDRRAIGSRPGRATFDRRGGAFSGRLVGEGARYTPTENIELVETVSVDHLVSEEGHRPPDIVKIDVEGNEGIVLEGMRQTMERHGPIIICELHRHLGDSSELVLSLLASHGYSVSDAKETTGGGGGASARDLELERHIVARKIRPA